MLNDQGFMQQYFSFFRLMTLPKCRFSQPA